MTLKISHAGEERPLVRLFDAGGRQYYTLDYKVGNDMIMDMSHLAEGLYFIHVQSPHGYRTESIIVVK
jgi:hypothetical protein